MSLGCSTGDVRMMRLGRGVALLNKAWGKAESGETSWCGDSAGNTCERIGDCDHCGTGEGLSDGRDLSGGGSHIGGSGGHGASGGDGAERRECVGHGERIGPNSASSSWVDLGRGMSAYHTFSSNIERDSQ